MADDPFASAPEYRSRGWIGTLPLPYGKKTPPPSGFTGETGRWPDAADVKVWGHTHPLNIALRLPPNVIALDVDDLGAFSGLVQLVGPLPPTWRAHSGGERIGHFYYRLPAGVVSTGWGAPCPGVDLLRFGHRYSIVAPSLHPSGTRYAWARPDGSDAGTDLPGPGDLPELPAAWVSYLSGEGDQAGANAPTDRAELSRNRDDFGDPIRHNHEDALTAYAAHVVGLYPGITLEHAVSLVVARGRDCVPSWESGMRRELGHQSLEERARTVWVPSALRKFSREPDPIWPAYEAAIVAEREASIAANPRAAAVEKEADRLRVAAEARALVEAERAPEASEETVATRLVPGGAFVLDIPEGIPAIWGSGQDVLWARGEALIIAGPPGVGKTTIAHQLVEALINGGDVLGIPVETAGRTLYLACDRPAQIARALARRLSGVNREILDEKLVVWKGPPPGDFARDSELLTRMCRAAGATSVIVDSLKDVAVGLSEDVVGAGLNISRQTALAAGFQVLELHHLVKRGENGSAPTRLADLYGSAWISAGAGSVVLLWGEAGDTSVRLSHLKQPGATVGPFTVTHDHEAGLSSVHAVRRVEEIAGWFADGMTAKAGAVELYGDSDKKSIEKVRYAAEAAVRAGELIRSPDTGPGRGKEARWLPRCPSYGAGLARCPMEVGHGGSCAA